MKFVLPVTLCAALLVLAYASPHAQGDEGRRDGQQPLAQFSSKVQLVEVYATVTDAAGNPVMGLTRSDFDVYENNEAQDVTTFAAGDFPLTVALGVDRSFSMAGQPLRLAKDASQAFLRELRPEDRSMVVAINDEAEIIAPLSADRRAQAQAIASLDAWSTTALHDAIVMTLDRLAPERGRQAIVVFSDGVDRYSHATAAEVIDRARRSNALIYPIAFGKVRAALLPELAVATGGRSFQLRDARELQSTLATIARELRYQYLLGYAPSESVAPGEHEWRSIRVELKNRARGMRVRARDGYTT